MLQYDRRTPIYGYEIPSGVPRGVSDAVSLMLSCHRDQHKMPTSLILAHLVYQFIEVFVHRHCTGHYPISGGSGIEILLRICCLIGYYHNTAFILWAKIRKRFESYRTLNHYFSIFVFYAACHPTTNETNLTNCTNDFSFKFHRPCGRFMFQVL